MSFAEALVAALSVFSPLVVVVLAGSFSFVALHHRPPFPHHSLERRPAPKPLRARSPKQPPKRLHHLVPRHLRRSNTAARRPARRRQLKGVRGGLLRHVGVVVGAASPSVPLRGKGQKRGLARGWENLEGALERLIGVTPLNANECTRHPCTSAITSALVSSLPACRVAPSHGRRATPSPWWAWPWR